MRRFNAIRGQQAQIGRESRNNLAALPALRNIALAAREFGAAWAAVDAAAG